MRQTVGILGTPVDVLDTAAVLGRLEQFIAERRFHQVATANTDFLINALEDPELRYILRNADLVIPDGMPLVWASRLMRSPLPERVTGADLVPQLAALAADKGYRLFMLGARPEIAQQARDNLLARHPTLQIVGCMSPPVAPLLDMDHEGILEEIRKSRPDVLLVAFGNPKQEKWIHMNRMALAEIPICIGVGGTFDFIAGRTARAPQWMQRSGLEWVYRLRQEPRRLGGRYAKDLAHFSRYLYRQWAAMRGQSFTGSGQVQSATVGEFTVLSIVGDLAGITIDQVQDAAELALQSQRQLILDLHGVTGIDGLGLGMLINLPKRAASHQVEMRLACVPPFLIRVLERCQLLDGPYRIAVTLASAMTMVRRESLTWQVQLGSDAALVEVRGESDPKAASCFELVCISLLKAGRRVDLDLSCVTYVDLCLLAALNRIAGRGSGEPLVRIVAGDALRSVLQRENIEDRFTLLDAPELPLAVVQGDLNMLREMYTGDQSSARTAP